jgi:hypothetical protein
MAREALDGLQHLRWLLKGTFDARSMALTRRANACGRLIAAGHAKIRDQRCFASSNHRRFKCSSHDAKGRELRRRLAAGALGERDRVRSIIPRREEKRQTNGGTACCPFWCEPAASRHKFMSLAFSFELQMRLSVQSAMVFMSPFT